jgi:hypothetical protein
MAFISGRADIFINAGESLKKHSFYYTFKQREELKV